MISLVAVVQVRQDIQVQAVTARHTPRGLVKVLTEPEAAAAAVMDHPVLALEAEVV
jgi:hypothetical protein